MLRRPADASLPPLIIRGSSRYRLPKTSGTMLTFYSAHLVFTMLDEIVAILFDE